MYNLTHKYILKDINNGTELEIYHSHVDLELIKGSIIVHEETRYIVRDIERIVDFDVEKIQYKLFIDKNNLDI
jgi:5-bromo-4-chloroindolyl phosphate hydrolysis protein